MIIFFYTLLWDFWQCFISYYKIPYYNIPFIFLLIPELPHLLDLFKLISKILSVIGWINGVMATGSVIFLTFLFLMVL